MSEEIRAEHTEENGWEIHVDRAEAQPVTILGLEVVSDDNIEENHIILEAEDENGVTLSAAITEERLLNVEFIREERARYIQLAGQDPHRIRVHPDDWDDVEEIVSYLERPREEAVAIPWTTSEYRPQLNVDELRRAVAGNHGRLIHPERDPAPRGRIETFRQDDDLNEEQWLYPEGLVTMAGANSCRSSMRLEAMQEYDQRDPHAYVTLYIPDMQIRVTTRNAPIPAINWSDQGDVEAYYRAMRRRVFKHVTAYLRAEFERHKRANPQGQRSQILPF